MDKQAKELDKLYDKFNDYVTGKFIEHDFAAIQLTKDECKVIMDALMTKQVVIKLIDDGR